jgi:23S rRNA (pseudouridine1915-N3)-methyltransferase
VRLSLVAVGRAKDGPERALFQHYQRRLSPPGLALREVEEKRPLPAPQLKAREAELLLGALPPAALVVALDERGQTIDSMAFAARLGAWRDSGVADLAFVIGGADGLDQSVRDRAALLVSFGKMTWPHMLVRALLAEQLYRAQAILAGHPYHRA